MRIREFISPYSQMRWGTGNSMELVHQKGKNKGKIVLYALSTCVWCGKTKQLLMDLGVDFSYIYVDLLDRKDLDTIYTEVKRWNPSGSFPVVVIDDRKCIVGFKENEIREALGT